MAAWVARSVSAGRLRIFPLVALCTLVAVTDRDRKHEIDGRCHCGYITYEAEIEPEKVMICHCTDCQTLSGSAFRTIAFTREGTFKLLSGELKVYAKTGESGTKRPQSFCPECGTPIYSSTIGDGPKVHVIRVGTIRQRDQLVPKVQLWCTRKLHYVVASRQPERDRWLADFEDTDGFAPVRRQPSLLNPAPKEVPFAVGSTPRAGNWCSSRTSSFASWGPRRVG